ncbi:MotA/TolQ/ExbB proton channel family protein [uncultured Erythrobacter sp.]|uniref:MotA/TolQ/ExbB proton channel family protein n=1 Tax=uncultured Erythrobacter sp. TaxID=263913 RepID=UPI00262D8D39|nr:MotA/TolQ/ExbB proton channel family protein [uncultured Erythrobacter sp.]
MLSETAASSGGILEGFFDPAALVVVLAGTFLATIARCGGREIRAAGRALIRLGKRTFDEDANRAALARSVSAIAKRGHLCAETSTPPDPATARLVDAYVVSGSLDLLHSTARAERAHREIAMAQAVRVFEFAGELAPVFGLVGTLFSITQLAPSATGSAAEVTMAAVGTAVLSSLYGVLTANLVCIPLARAIERRGEREEEVRADLLEWFDAELTGGSTRSITPVQDAA